MKPQKHQRANGGGLETTPSMFRQVFIQHKASHCAQRGWFALLLLNSRNMEYRNIISKFTRDILVVKSYGLNCLYEKKTAVLAECESLHDLHSCSYKLHLYCTKADLVIDGAFRPFSFSWQHVSRVLPLLPVDFTCSSRCCLKVTVIHTPGVSLCIQLLVDPDFKSSGFTAVLLSPCSCFYNLLSIPAAAVLLWHPRPVGGGVC